MRHPITGSLLAMAATLAVVAVGLTTLPSCKPKTKPGLTPAERCRKGCELRVRCIEEMALEKAVTDANREHIRRTQQKDHQGYVDYCVKACDAGRARFVAFAKCGVEAKDCEDYFRCESAATRAPDRDAPRSPPAREPRPGAPRTP